VTCAPAAYSTVATPSKAARTPSSGVTVDSGNTLALPPPWMRAVAAFGPMTATLRRVAGSSGSRLSSLRTKTLLRVTA
jgi:hypothetical protein